MTERSRRCFTGYFRVHRICLDIALHRGGQDSSCAPWHMVLVIKPKPDVPVVQTSGLWNCFQIHSQDQGQQVSLLGVGLFFKTAFFVLGPHWDFTISWTGELGEPQKHFFACGPVLNYCYWGRNTQSRDVLWGHLAQTCFVSFPHSGGEWRRNWNIKGQCKWCEKC